jgi:excisionase family DNA binding protein
VERATVGERTRKSAGSGGCLSGERRHTLSDTMLPTPSTAAAVAREPLLLVSRDAAAYLAIGERTLWELTRRGEIRAMRIGRAVRYDCRDLVAYVDRQRAARQPA